MEQKSSTHGDAIEQLAPTAAASEPRTAQAEPRTTAGGPMCDGGTDAKNICRISLDLGSTSALRVENLPPNLNIKVRFYEADNEWYTKFYKSYMGQLWERTLRGGGCKSTKWLFKCNVCTRVLCSFKSLKSHLNIHMGFYPYGCTVCGKHYVSCRSYQKHIKFCPH